MKKTTRTAKKSFQAITKLLEKEPAKKKELAEYLTRHLGEKGREYRVGEITRWFTTKERTDFCWAIGHFAMRWYVDNLKK